jgi:hypothetical protein
VNRLFSGAVKVAGSLAVIGGAIVAAAGPAGAATPVSAWGAQASPPQFLAPVAPASTLTFTPNSASNANLPGLLATGTIFDRASTTTGYALVNSPLVTLRAVQAWVKADQVTSTCRMVGPFTFGSADVPNGSITQTGQSTIALPAAPAPNTTYVLPGGATVTLNKQTTIGPLRTVVAVQVTYGPQIVNLGVTTC